ncbi:hypothetical protein PFISCL1PPCAC_14190, partial [Pristionchus fissidentatus]
LLLLSTGATVSALPYDSPPLVPSSDDVLLKRQFDQFSERFLQPDDFDLAEKTPVDRPTSAQLDAVQNSLLFEGDIVGMPTGNRVNKSIVADIAHLRRLRDDPMIDEDVIFGRPYHSSLNLVTYPDKLWSDGRVPYVLEDGMTKEQRAAIAQAFDEYKTKTCVRFVPKEDEDEDFIFLKRNVAFGCSSYVGRAGGNQTVSLEIDKCFSKGIIAHELMHSLGFFHEHSRTDRDQFVHIADDNIRQGMMRNFEKYPRKIIDPLGMPYDYESVMHYHKLAFSKNGKATIVPKDANAEIGQRYRLSEMDAAKINKLYQCSDSEIEENSVTTEQPTTRKPKATTKAKSRVTSSTRWPARKTSTTTEESTTTETEEEIEEEDKTTTMKMNPSTSVRTRTTSNRWNGKKTTTTSAPEETIEKKEKKCVDLNAHCEMWESLGHCQHSTKYMAHYCRKSCSMCDKDTDLVEKPEESTMTEKSTTTTTTTEPTTTVKTTKRTRSSNDISRPFPYIFGGSSTTEKPTTTTAKTTTTTEETTTTKKRASTTVSTRNSGSSGTCRDKNLFCSYWAKIGECASESKFMRIFCKRSCGRCEE